MKNSCKGVTWLSKNSNWCNNLDCRPNIYNTNCNYKE